ncbi:MAG TPA: hypothetical protein PKU76_02925 [Candidatus Cloacimonas sp.]|nr:hypothetical protein [Candidatus Cloacimonas sp.]
MLLGKRKTIICLGFNFNLSIYEDVNLPEKRRPRRLKNLVLG